MQALREEEAPPDSNYYVEETGRVIHVPWFGQMMPCRNCRARGGALIEPARGVEGDEE